MEQSGQFRKAIGLTDGIMMVAGTMIGSGIFIVSADIARQVGASGYLLLVWALSGVLTVLAALAYGELTAMFPRAGGQYVFLREAYNERIAFLYGWALFLVIQTGTIAAVAVAFAKFTSVLFPALGEDRVLLQLGSKQITAARLLAIGIIFLLTAINMRGVSAGKWIQTIFSSTKIIALLGLILFGLVAANPDSLQINFTKWWQATQTIVHADNSVERIPLAGWTLVVAIAMAMVGSMFSMDAWNNITFAGEEVINAKKNIALSMAIGTLLVTVLYLLINVAYLAQLPLIGVPDDGRNLFVRGIQFASHDRVGIALADALAGHTAVIATAALIMVSTFSCLNGLILTGARVYFKMADDGLFFPAMRKLNVHGVPAKSLALQAVWASGLCLSGTYGNLLDYVVFTVLLFYLLTIGGIYVLRRKQPHVPRTYRALGYPFLPAVYLVLVALMCSILLWYKPTFTWPGLIIVLLGLPVYHLFRMLRKPAAKAAE